MNILSLFTRLSVLMHGSTALWNLAISQHNERLAQNLSKVKASAQDVDWAIKNLAFRATDRNANILRYALQSGLDPNLYHYGMQREYLLHYAACRGDIELVEMLVEAKANPNCRDEHEYTPLFCALTGFGEEKGSWEQRKKVVSYLLLHDTASKLQGLYKESCLKMTHYDPDVFKALIEAGAPIQWDEWDYKTLGHNRDGAHAVQKIIGQKYALFELSAHLLHERVEESLLLLEQLGQDSTTTNQGNNLLLDFFAEPVYEENQDQLKQCFKQQYEMLQKRGYHLTNTNTRGQNVWHVLLQSPRTSDDSWVSVLNEYVPQLLHACDNHGHTPFDLVGLWPDNFEQERYNMTAFIEKQLILNNLSNNVQHTTNPSKARKM